MNEVKQECSVVDHGKLWIRLLVQLVNQSFIQRLLQSKKHIYVIQQQQQQKSEIK